MPVYCLEGTPGSGKSLYLCQQIIPDFLKIKNVDGSLVPRHIYTNIEGLKPDILCSYLDLPASVLVPYFHRLGERVDENGNVYEDKDLIRYFYYESETIEWINDKDERGKTIKVPNKAMAVTIPHNSLVIIDELQNYFGGRDFSTRYSRDCVDFLTKNRHYGWTIWWASQSVESVDITFRRNTQYVYFLEKKEIYGFKNTASVKMYEGWLSGEKTSVPPFAVKSFHYDKKFYNVYSSYVAGGVQEKRYSTNIFLNNKGFMAMVIIAILCILYVIFRNPLDTFSGKNLSSSQKTPQTAKSTPRTESFSGSGGSSQSANDEGKQENKEPCYINFLVHNGIPYYVMANGELQMQGKQNLTKCSME